MNDPLTMETSRIKMIRHPRADRVKEGKTEKERGPLLSQSLGLGIRETVSLVGAGGKTTLMFRLAKELVKQKKRVLTTTTTRILEPNANETPVLLIDSDENRIKQFVEEHLDQYHHITLAKERLESGKLKGVSPNLVEDLWSSLAIDYFIVEADGARGQPVKAPREGEPVIPVHTTMVVGILGVDGVGMELREDRVCGAERVSQLTGIPIGAKLNSEAMVVLMTHPEGIFKGVPTSSRVVALLNKVDLPNGMAKARRIAREILQRNGPRIERVVLARLKWEPPIAEVFFPVTSPT